MSGFYYRTPNFDHWTGLTRTVVLNELEKTIKEIRAEGGWIVGIQENQDASFTIYYQQVS